MKPNFLKNADGLLPVIVQDANSNIILMQGYMNEEAFAKTLAEERVTFFSRSKNRLWTKGESSGNFLTVKEIILDCDYDSILIKAIPAGPVCHSGADTCFGENNSSFSLSLLESVIAKRKANPASGSYTAQLFAGGINKIAQKVGEEAVELVIESKDNDDEKFLNEAADLLFHYLVLLKAKNYGLQDVVNILGSRNK